jgi:hypothetical protein
VPQTAPVKSSHRYRRPSNASKIGVVVTAAMLLAFEGCGLLLVRAGVSTGGAGGAFTATVGGLIALFWAWGIFIVAAHRIRIVFRRVFAREGQEKSNDGSL